MSVDQVNHFVDGCMSAILGIGVLTDCPDYPSYELFTETLREGVFKPRHPEQSDPSDWQGRQLRLVVDKDRRVQEVIRI